MEHIADFGAPNRFLSNFYPSPIEVDGMVWPTVEHAYQGSKTVDPTQRILILSAHSPGLAKQFGKRVTLRPGFDEVKVEIMRRLVRAKFSPGTELSKLLIRTYPKELVEGNWWGDRFWGVYKGEGLNHLGKILMEIRAELMKRSVAG